MRLIAPRRLAITRSPTRCIGCGQQQGAPHLAGCRVARFTIRRNR
jgi:hypothetical protein